MVFKPKHRRGRRPRNVLHNDRENLPNDAVEGLLLLGQEVPEQEAAEALNVPELEKAAEALDVPEQEATEALLDDSALANLAAELNINTSLQPTSASKWLVDTLAEDIPSPLGKSTAIASPTSLKWRVTPLQKTPQSERKSEKSDTKRSLNFGCSENADNYDDVMPLSFFEDETEETIETSEGQAEEKEQLPFFIFEDAALTTCPCIWKEDCPSCSLPKEIIIKPHTERNTTWRKKVLSFELFITYPEKEFTRLTGVTKSQFQLLLDLIGRDTCEHLKYEYKRGTPSKGMSSVFTKLSIEDRLLMTLLRLRRGWDLDDLGLLFGVTESQASKVVYTWLQALYFELKRLEPAMFVSRHIQKEVGLPAPFKPFHNFRVILDTTEIRIEAPEDFMEQGNTYSDYKGGNVIMYLIGSSSWGSVSYVSPGFEGSISDVELYRRSGIREFLEEGDLLLVDRGFRIQEECDEDKVICVHPPFLKTRDKYTPEEEQLKREIAKARIYVEHVNRKIKVFKILKNIKNSMLPYLDQIVYIVGFLVNLQTPHVKTALEKEMCSGKE